MSKRPSTHEEWVDAVRAVVERLRGDAELRDADGRTLAAAVIRDDITIISALLPPLPEPIKVGDRVRHIPSGDMEATVTDLGTERAIFVQLDDGQDDVWLTKHTERVAPAPSDTEQEPGPVDPDDDPAHLLYLALIAAREALCLAQREVDHVLSLQIDLAVARVDHIGATMLDPDQWSADYCNYTFPFAERLGLPPVAAPSSEPVECDDPEALAAAVAAGQVVEGMTPGGGWVRLVGGAVDQWRNWLSRPGNRARIWPSGSTPGGAS